MVPLGAHGAQLSALSAVCRDQDTIWEPLRSKGMERDPQPSGGRDAGHNPVLSPCTQFWAGWL